MLMKVRTKTLKGSGVWLTLLLGILWLVPAAQAQSSYVPPVVVTAPTTVTATGLPNYQAHVAIDLCGNFYTLQSGSVYSDGPAVNGGLLSFTPSGGGSVQAVYPAAGTSYNANTMFMDATKTHLYISEGPDNLYRIPISNCTLQTSAASTISIGNLGSVSYYWDAGAVAADVAGDIFIGTDTDCCANGNELIEENAGQTQGTNLLLNLPDPIVSMVLDASGNIYYVQGGGLYELPVTTPATSTTTAVYAANPVSYGSGYSTNVVGVTMDSAGNLYVSDAGSNLGNPSVPQNGVVYEIPLEGDALNPADQFVLANGLSVTSEVATDTSGNIYYLNVNYNGAPAGAQTENYIYELTRNSATFGQQGVGRTGSSSVNVVFNEPETLTGISFASANPAFSTGTGTCATGTAYAAGSACLVTANFTPLSVGATEGSLLLSGSTGTLATVAVSGIGLGAEATIDPGTPMPTGAGISSAESLTVDGSGNLYIADSAGNTIWELPSGQSTPVPIATNVNSPQGITVDGAGNLYISEPSSNQIISIPVVGGSLNAAAAYTLVSSTSNVAGSTLNGPTGLTIDLEGNLYIADTGNGRIVFLPHYGGYNISQATTVSSGFISPTAVAVTSSGLIYVADSSNGKIVSVPYAGPGAIGTLVASGFTNPTTMQVDAAGDLFVVDAGSGKITRIPSVGGALVTSGSSDVSIGIAGPTSLSFDLFGDLYVGTASSTNPLYVVNRSSPTLSFGNINPGTSSSPASVQVESSGNQPIVFAAPYYSATGATAAFSVSTSVSNSCADSATIATGTSCAVQATFTPPTFATDQETLALQSNAIGSPQINLSGVGITTQPTTTTIALTSPMGSPAYDEPISLTATVTSPAGTPTGSVTLFVDGNQVGVSTLTDGVASFTLSAGLTGGNHSVQATYSGAVTSQFIFSGSSSSLVSIFVLAVATTTTDVAATQNFIPNSQPAGTPLTLTATVATSVAGLPTGVVTFNITDSGGQAVPPGTGVLTPVGGGLFQATYTFTPPSPASGVPYDTLSVTAVYSGDNNFATSQSAPTVFYVSPVGGAVAVTASGQSLNSSSSADSAITFTNTSYGGWNGIVSYQCDSSTLPANAVCLFSPGSVTVNASTSVYTYPPQTTTLKVVINNPPNSPVQGSRVWWIGGLMATMLLLRRRRTSSSLIRGLNVGVGLVLLLVTASGLLACGGSGIPYETPAGTSVVTVYADSDPFASGSTSVTQPCGGQVNGVGNPAVAPCAQAAFKVTLSVQ